MKKQLFLFSLFSLAIASSSADLNAAKPTKQAMGPQTSKVSAREWLKKHATHDQKKLIANLRIADEVAALKSYSFSFVPYESHEYNMFMKFPDYVQDYLNTRLPNTCFGGGHHCNSKKDCGTAPKIRKLEDHKPTAKDIENFDSNKDIVNF